MADRYSGKVISLVFGCKGWKLCLNVSRHVRLCNISKYQLFAS